MTANGKIAMLVIGVIAIAWMSANMAAYGYWSFGGGFLTQLAVQVFALWPLALIAGLIWIGSEIVGSLRRIEKAVAGRTDMHQDSPYVS